MKRPTSENSFERSSKPDWESRVTESPSSGVQKYIPFGRQAVMPICAAKESEERCFLETVAAIHPADWSHSFRDFSAVPAAKTPISWIRRGCCAVREDSSSTLSRATQSASIHRTLSKGACSMRKGFVHASLRYRSIWFSSRGLDAAGTGKPQVRCSSVAAFAFTGLARFNVSASIER